MFINYLTFIYYVIKINCAETVQAVPQQRQRPDYAKKNVVSNVFQSRKHTCIRKKQRSGLSAIPSFGPFLSPDYRPIDVVTKRELSYIRVGCLLRLTD